MVKEERQRQGAPLPLYPLNKVNAAFLSSFRFKNTEKTS
jgi:hypothetical protein